jgi:hypothetical protein
MLISSLVAFQSGRSISLRAMNWTAIGPDQLTMVRAALQEEIDAITHIQSAP